MVYDWRVLYRNEVRISAVNYKSSAECDGSYILANLAPIYHEAWPDCPYGSDRRQLQMQFPVLCIPE